MQSQLFVHECNHNDSTNDMSGKSNIFLFLGVLLLVVFWFHSFRVVQSNKKKHTNLKMQSSQEFDLNTKKNQRETF